MHIKILMITYNRPIYTKLSLKYLCKSVAENVKITVWDNGSDIETKEVIDRFRNHPRIEKIIYNNKNEKLRKPTNSFWEDNLDSDLLGKVDDDCLVPYNWCKILETAHKDISQAGILACWHFLEEDFRYELARKKIFRYGTHQIMRNCWVGGSGYLMKGEIVRKIGLLKKNDSFTDYCINAAAKGYINGWYYPFIYQEHMDDPRVPNTGIITDEDFMRLFPLSAQNFNIKSKEQWIERLRQSAYKLQVYSYNPKDYIGFKPKIKKKLFTLFGREYLPRVR